MTSSDPVDGLSNLVGRVGHIGKPLSDGRACDLLNAVTPLSAFQGAQIVGRRTTYATVRGEQIVSVMEQVPSLRAIQPAPVDRRSVFQRRPVLAGQSREEKRPLRLASRVRTSP